MVNGFVKDFEILCQILKRLDRESRKQWRNLRDFSGQQLSKDTIENHDFLINTKPPMSSEELEEAIRENMNNLLIDLKKPFYLPPLEGNREFIPILSVHCNFRESPPEFCLRIGMYSLLMEEKIQIRGFGFRFEMGVSGSNHDYYHAQITRKPLQGLNECLDWIPENIPCILTPAKCPVSLLFCMLISFYGKRICKMISDMNIDNKYKEPLKFLS